jgi:CCR4-NOT transcription complex subunit 6
LALSRFSDLTGDRTGLERLMTKDNVGVIVLLQSTQLPPAAPQRFTASGRRIVQPKPRPQNFLIANTHIHWDPSMSDVKLMQVQFLVEELANLRSRLKDPAIPMILCGDFNSTPQSAVYQLLRSGEISATSSDFNGFNFGKYTEDGVKHMLRLNSAYGVSEEPPFTNYNGDFIGVLDYLWYTESVLRVLGVLQPHTLDEIRNQKSPLPNPHFPSDHLLLMAEFEVTTNQPNKPDRDSKDSRSSDRDR